MQSYEFTNELVIPIISNIIRTEYNHNISELDICAINGGYRNLIYSYVYNDKSYIVRVSNSIVRKKEMIECELEWIQYLYNKNISVSTPIISSRGDYIKEIKLNNYLGYIVVFNKAKGNQINYQNYIENICVFEQMGKTMGKIHKNTKEFIPSNVKRNEWIDNSYKKI